MIDNNRRLDDDRALTWLRRRTNRVVQRDWHAIDMEQNWCFGYGVVSVHTPSPARSHFAE